MYILYPVSDFVFLSTDFLSNDILQPKKTDNFFITKHAEINNIKRNAGDILQKDKYALCDTDNNNRGTSGPKEHNNTSYPAKFISNEEQNYNKKLYWNLKSFDPLNSGNDSIILFPCNE